MKRQLLRSSSFIRAARKAVKKDPRVVDDIKAALEMLEKGALIHN